MSRPHECHNCALLQLEIDRLKREVRDLEDEIRDTAKGAYSEGVWDERERQEEWR